MRLALVGGADTTVLELNRETLESLGGRQNLHLVEGAGHLFEGEGELAEGAGVAADWFASGARMSRALDRPGR